MTAQLSKVAEGYVRSINGNDPAGFIDLFADEAVVDDAGRVIRGRDAIRAWAASDIFAVNVTLDVLDAVTLDGDTVLTVKVDGTFDRTGLPDPLVMTNGIANERGKIVALTCRLANTPGRG